MQAALFWPFAVFDGKHGWNPGCVSKSQLRVQVLKVVPSSFHTTACTCLLYLTDRATCWPAEGLPIRCRVFAARNQQAGTAGTLQHIKHSRDRRCRHGRGAYQRVETVRPTTAMDFSRGLFSSLSLMNQTEPFSAGFRTYSCCLPISLFAGWYVQATFCSVNLCDDGHSQVQPACRRLQPLKSEIAARC
jgi:hypothetical protein